MRGVNNSVETVNAAASAILTAESRVQEVTSPRRRWVGCFSMSWCFGSQRHEKRIRHAALVPEPTLPGSGPMVPENPDHPPPLVLPYVAPPSSPASFLQSEPPSAAQSPTGPLPLTALTSNSYSPIGPHSIFAIGPYANETQPVSPPVFSTFTTEPSTAPLTPPPESLHQTTPSSPEVPFARLLASSLDPNHRTGEAYEFQLYQLYPGSPIGNLISPNSMCSGTSSPFPDLEFHSSVSSSFPSFPTGEPPKLLTAEALAVHKLTPKHASRNDSSVLNGQISASVPMQDLDNRPQNGETAVDHRVSFESTVEEVSHCLAKEPVISARVASEPSPNTASTSTAELDQPPNDVSIPCVDGTYHDLPEKLQQSAALANGKEFKFDNTDGTSAKTTVGSDWWANEKVEGNEEGCHKSWPFFPTIQPEGS